MAATGKTPILLYGSTTPTNAPVAGNLTNSSDGCEIAINVADKNLFFKDSSNNVNTVPIRQSSASSNGWLSSTDWSAFNGKVSSQWVTSGSNIYYSAGSVGFGGVTTPHCFGAFNPGTFGANNNTAGCSFGIDSNGATQPLAGMRWTGASAGITGGAYTSQLVVDSANSPNGLEIYTTGSSSVTIGANSTGVVEFQSGGNASVLNGNLVIGTSGKGIDFSATPGTGTSELLADYEEGTWTPSTSTANLSVTSIQSAIYTKVGRQVTAYCYITVNNTAGGTLGDWTMTGLPYVCNYGFGMAARYYGPNSYSDDCYVNSGTSYVIDVQNLPAGSSSIMMFVTYYT